MTQVHVHESSGAPKTPEPSGDSVIVDELGRRLRIREPDIVNESRLVRAMGESAMNAAYMVGYVQPAAMVVAIDDQEFPFPRTEREVEAAIQRLGREGQRAVMGYITSKAEASSEVAQEIKN